jgi:hypothetical protein
MAKQLNPKVEENMMDVALKQSESEKVEIDDMPLESIRDYRLYNEEARKANKKLRICRYPIKPCPVELHPKQRIRISNNDKSTHPIKCFLSNHLIHFEQELTAGNEYDLPECVVDYLAKKGYPVWGWVTLKDGSKETAMINKTPRFSVTSVFNHME